MADDKNDNPGPDPTNDTGWRPVTDVVGGDEYAEGRIELAKGTEKHPCFMCRSWVHDEKRITEHFISNGLEAGPDGKFRTPIARDFPGRRSMALDPKDFGWCRKDGIATDMLATCQAWEQKRTRTEFK